MFKIALLYLPVPSAEILGVLQTHSEALITAASSEGGKLADDPVIRLEALLAEASQGEVISFFNEIESHLHVPDKSALGRVLQGIFRRHDFLFPEQANIKQSTKDLIAARTQAAKQIRARYENDIEPREHQEKQILEQKQTYLKELEILNQKEEELSGRRVQTSGGLPLSE